MDPDSIEPEIAAMVKEILNQHSFNEVLNSSSEAASLYRSVQQIIQKIENEGNMKGTLPKEPIQPSKRRAFRLERQRVIFNIQPERYSEDTRDTSPF